MYILDKQGADFGNHDDSSPPTHKKLIETCPEYIQMFSGYYLLYEDVPLYHSIYQYKGYNIPERK